MKFAVVVALVLVVGVTSWSVVNQLSLDAIGMAVGLGFGVLAGIPASLLVLIASRRRAPWEEEDEDWQPPIQVVPSSRRETPVVPPLYRDEATPYYNGAIYLMGLPPLPERPKQEERQFRIVGQTEADQSSGVPPWLRS
jgi:hypothetical protein